MFKHTEWATAEIPGSVCGASKPIHLIGGTAVVMGSHLHGYPYVHAALGVVRYGDIDGDRPDDAAVNVWCDNGSGTADGQLADAWVIFAEGGSNLVVLGVLTPKQRYNPDVHVPYFDGDPGGISMAPGRTVVKELWYGPVDATCCPSGRATSVWTYRNGRLRWSITTMTHPYTP